jgi:hypothetical protein
LGLSTAFYNERNEDIANVLTKTLIETGQEVPDFLQRYVPENIADLKFEEDSEDENALDTGGNEDEGWGAPVTELPGGDFSGDWGAAPAKVSEVAHDASSTATVKHTVKAAPITSDTWGAATDSSTW